MQAAEFERRKLCATWLPTSGHRGGSYVGTVVVRMERNPLTYCRPRGRYCELSAALHLQGAAACASGTMDSAAGSKRRALVSLDVI